MQYYPLSYTTPKKLRILNILNPHLAKKQFNFKWSCRTNGCGPMGYRTNGCRTNGLSDQCTVGIPDSTAPPLGTCIQHTSKLAINQHMYPDTPPPPRHTVKLIRATVTLVSVWPSRTRMLCRCLRSRTVSHYMHTPTAYIYPPCIANTTRPDSGNGHLYCNDRKILEDRQTGVPGSRLR